MEQRRWQKRKATIEEGRIVDETKRRAEPRALVSCVKAFHPSPPQRVIHQSSALAPKRAASYASLVANNRPFHVKMTQRTPGHTVLYVMQMESWIVAFLFATFTDLQCNVDHSMSITSKIHISLKATHARTLRIHVIKFIHSVAPSRAHYKYNYTLNCEASIL